jgi:hypothetical protein
MKYFQKLKIIVPPKSRNKVIFACDGDYFNSYGIYNLLSCNNHNHDVHVHIINPTKELLNKINEITLSIDLSISIEELDTSNINFYKLKSYYFCSRYFICDYLFNNDSIDTAYITDADIIFNENISFDNTVTLGILHYPKYESLWKQTGANFLYVTKERKSFVNKIVNLYQKYVETNDFEIISNSTSKSVRADIYGLDQVCMSEIIKNETNFFNLATIENFVSKKQNSKIWSLTGPWKKNPNIKSILEKHVTR